VLNRARITFALLLASIACASPPRATEASKRIRANPPAIVEGRVVDTEGKPVAGVGVRGVPRGKDIPWYPPATTQADGTFRLRLAAPGSYGFYLISGGEVVITDDPREPARLDVPLAPGETRRGLELIFLRAQREKAAAETSAPRAKPPV
jgi:hypothetical protein